MSTESPSFAWWLLRKMLPFLVIGAILGATIFFIKADHPDILHIVKIIGSVVFGLIFILYSWWAISRPQSGYNWSYPERLGIFVSAVAALILSARLALPKLPGAIWIYFIVAFVLAFVVRPILDNYGWNKYHGEQDAAPDEGSPRR